ncbi:MAG: phosphoribosylamine--glycine ligase [Acidobacteria bacterium RIFCSPLOWO2_02_FULL_67_36]|nr:MAG: phosphoribosylamine--glycine ligase [Acidobacteria bacterium RIFCSPLOWO2_02_FULL_67_36]OFW20718.1 MAG: phosphoribosylamine--glycine ligase [Acidobacteria bacterium RIFCSPLOWO2_12_FULL_66_21]
MNILVVGGGGREHALAWKLAGEAGGSRVLCAPGNAGIATVARLAEVGAADPEALASLAEREHIDLTVVGPEIPLDRGIADLFFSRGLRIFGPSRAAAQLECSKVFAKAFMARHGIPTARYRVCDRADEARDVIRSGELGLPIVIKADGLAAGKGVVVAPTRDQANAAVSAAMEQRQFGEAGARVVLEECLAGPEVSFFALCDGTRATPLMTAQDHKRVFDNDEGPNTGGMGAFAPSPLADAALEARVMREIVDPVVAGLHEEGHEYRGFLYAGLMLTCDGPKVIEFNVRFGDPEAQVVIPMVADPLAPWLVAAAEGSLPPGRPAFTPERHVGVVLASRGYPGSGPTGLPISGLDEAARLDDVLVFHAGTARRDGEIVTAGGRVLTVVGRGASYEQAIARAYDGVSRIHFEGMHFRRDIGLKALHAQLPTPNAQLPIH